MRKGNVIQKIAAAAVFIILEAAAVSMLGHNGTLQKIWFSRGVHKVSGAIWGGAQEIKEYFLLKKRNEELAFENYRLRLQLTREAAEKAVSGKGGEVAGDFRYIYADIIKISNNTQHNYMIINRGLEDGVREGAGVITGKGAIGVIDAVSNNYSYARSFKNHDMSISARLGREGAVGPMIWDGTGSSGAILKEIPHHVEVNAGDTVYTSGYSSIFPPDIPVGVTGESKIVNGATYEIRVRLFENFSALRHVTIVEKLNMEELEKLEKDR
ncbi:MAG: rod shape-determining protein MreC [Bacteroidales bacterium]|nr:rod shape-determining protein MreC [Bacteroidales bacterium]MDE6147882.1 rod shape-determining protein MreC [Bacteroidales bacterium]